MQHRASHIAISLAVVFMALPLLAFAQDQAAQEQPKREAPKPRLDLYGDPLPEGAVARMGTVRLRLPKGSPSLALSPDGKTIAVAGDSDTVVRLWDTGAGQLLQTLAGHESGVEHLEFLPDGKSLVTVTGLNSSLVHGRLRMWNVSSGEAMTVTEPLPLTVHSLALAPDGVTVALAGYRYEGKKRKGVVSLRVVATGRPMREFSGHDGPIQSVAFAPDGEILATSGEDMTIRLWKLGIGPEEVRRFSQHTANSDPYRRMGIVGHLCFSPDGKILASMSVRGALDPGVAHLWEVSTGKELRELAGKDPHRRRGGGYVTFSPDGRTLVSGDDTAVRLWDVATGKKRLTLPYGGLTDAAYSMDGKTLAIAHPGGVRVLDPKTGRNMFRRQGHLGKVIGMAFTPDGRRLASAGDDRTIRTWETETSRQIRELPAGDIRGAWLLFGPNGRYLASVHQDGRSYDLRYLRIWDVSDGRMVGQHDFGPRIWHRELREESPDRLLFAADGRALATGSLLGQVRLWNLPSGDPSSDFLGTTTKTRILGLEFSEAGGILDVWDGRGDLHRWDLIRHQRIGDSKSYSDGSVEMTAYSRSGPRVALGDRQGRIHIWNTQSGKKVATIPAHPVEVDLLRFSADGDKLLSHPNVRPDGLSARQFEPHFRLWKVATGTELVSVQAEPGSTSTSTAGGKTEVWPDPERLAADVELFPDGRWLAAGGRDGKVYIWEVATGQVLRAFDGHSRRILDVSLTPDGHKLSSACEDGTVLIWDVTPTCVARAKTSAPGNAEAMATQWARLADQDASMAAKAMMTLVEAGDEAVLYLKDVLRPIPEDISESARQLVLDLDSDDFALREGASQRLSKMGEHASVALRDALARQPSPELRLRAEVVLANFVPPFKEFPSEVLRGLRGVQALEWFGSAAAKDLIRELATGSPHALQTREAKAALERLEGRRKSE